MSLVSRSVETATLPRWITSLHGWALAGGALMTLVYLSVVFHVVDVVGGVGGVGLFVAEVVAALALAVVLSRTIRGRQAVAIGALLLITGLFVYLAVVPRAYIDLEKQLGDTFALLTGLSVLRMTKAGVWALGFTPGPLFVSWYFFLRRKYALGVLAGGVALGFFILTGDLDTITGLIGVIGAVGAIGFGELDREGGTAPQRSTMLTVLIAMLVVTTSISLVPGGEAQPLLSGQGRATIEGSLLSADNRVSILGNIDLSPRVRFTVTADRSDYWRAGAYDRYTGGGWVRTGTTASYAGPLDRPLSTDTERIRQTFEAESTVNTMPAVWKPVRVGRGANRALVTSMGGLAPAEAFEEGDRYSVVSYRTDPSARELRVAGDDYPEAIEERYLQLPESTPDRVTRFTDQLTANAETPYETAVVIERWLEENKEYSLEVERPDGNVAAAFLFEMDKGYCTYYATAMVTMLRTQGIPSRFVVGYTPGQSVGNDTWIVRGYNSHAWVEVYFPDEGWIRFDPTPAGPRAAAEGARLEQARASNERNVDTDLTREVSAEETAMTGTPRAVDPGDVRGNDPDAINTFGTDIGYEPGGNPAALLGSRTEAGAGGTGTTGGRLPSRETVLYGLILLAGGATALHRTGLFGRSYRWLWLRRTPDGPPARRIEATFARVEYLLGRWHRPRREGETPREYIEAIGRRTTFGPGGTAADYDARVRRLFDLYERARYAGAVTDADADAAQRLLRDLVDERSWW